ncbi:aminotransferase class I/II-fold pyridoxal phosphate-dependent enzyme [Arthrobacter sp. TES]|uniref:pyridoxal phosphate-dependent aminotransferase n=1 Tax=Paenarthrobacter ureafaciens TaxID=37931 RepID=UPI0003971548|nr:aminotransferase class I/II-fold pyridoxal phosphate-dependent enzyme [Paenarthrobacter ureafaciens]AOY73204.1 aspartate aminotransferase [Arthrobacter sp. ZXY-2]ERI38960.1 aspartate aminotransferase [Arthrobacter sp. AK-YN10]QOI64766.1 aminotransferase class I/II-fold pyridoxal phosphate-dependent enzyme [Arthrobacter sp. TES]GLU59670.1 aminotransferase [Paenarthrobacter ureafaciens]GLU64075.1 aminotransferase [Paenarthrobacter ureafaciens]
MQKLARRLERLGTETAFSVAQAAAAWKAKGNLVYPFHLGDINIPTAPHIIEAMNKAIADGYTGYCPGPGIPQLREALAEDIGSRRGIEFSPENVVVMTGGKPVITKFLQAVMNPGEEVLYPNPGFPIYESQIEYLGGTAVPYRYVPTSKGFAIDLDQVRASITPNTTAIIYNDLQNPISAESTAAEREAIAQIAIEHDLWVLSDEAYFETRYEGVSSSITSIPGMAERTVILYTFSKKFAMTGSRLGCAVAPRDIAQVLSTLNTNDESCTTHYVQWAGIEALRGPQEPVQDMLDILKDRRDAACGIVNSIPGMSVAVPQSTFYLFPDVTEAMQKLGYTAVGDFASDALYKTGVSFCTREHFGRRLPGEDRQYIRLAYSGIETPAIEEGLGRLREWIKNA